MVQIYNLTPLSLKITGTIQETGYLHKSLATLNGEIVDPEITVKLEMLDVLKVHDAQT